jgi:hypothetical protein
MKRQELMWIFVCFALSFFVVDVWATPVPDTGQTKCYDVAGKVITCPSPGQALYGQDANYIINPMSYTKLDGSGNVLSDSATKWVMVKDNVTGVIWEMKTSKDGVQNYSDPNDADNTYTWYYSGDFIKALNDAHYGGYSDWRMPTIKELAYIVNYSILYQWPAIDTRYFPNTVSSFYWSSTSAGSTIFAWGMGFGDGAGGNYSSKSDSYYVRAVRGEQSGVLGDSVIGSFDAADSVPINDAAASTGGYTDNGDGTVTDTSTDLTWQQVGFSNTQTWEQALAYCEGLSLASHTDWRLPTIKELLSLLDHSRYNPAINTTYFPNAVSYGYWSSNTYASITHFAWFVYFSSGVATTYKDGGSYYVRAVRGGQPQPLDHSVISVSPVSRDLSKDAGTTTFSVSNTGTGTMPWTVAVTTGDSWLSITSGASGTNSGTINCSFKSNTSLSSRTATYPDNCTWRNGQPSGCKVDTSTKATNRLYGNVR